MVNRGVVSRTSVRGIARLLVGVAAVGGVLGCSSLFSSTNASGVAPEAGGYIGEVTFENQSGQDVCGVEWQAMSNSLAPNLNRIPNGSSGTFTTAVDNGRLIVTACDEPATLFGDRGGIGQPGQYISRLEHSRIVLYPAGAAPASAADHLALQVNRETFQDEWLRVNFPPEPALESAMMTELQRHASAQRWSETFVALRVGSADWSIDRNSLTSVVERRRRLAWAAARWPNGRCSLQGFSFKQEHDGSTFRDRVEFNGVDVQWSFPCTALDWMASRGGSGGAAVAPAPASGGRCENTCRTAHDNECDDGGPNSLYNVCALGTDCADCGPR